MGTISQRGLQCSLFDQIRSVFHYREMRIQQSSKISLSSLLFLWEAFVACTVSIFLKMQALTWLAIFSQFLGDFYQLDGRQWTCQNLITWFDNVYELLIIIKDMQGSFALKNSDLLTLQHGYSHVNQAVSSCLSGRVLARISCSVNQT